MGGSDAIYFDGVHFVSVAEAAKEFGFVRDYLARLCRQGVVRGRQIGGRWYVDRRALREFLIAREFRKAQAREDLRRERIAERTSRQGSPSKNLYHALAARVAATEGAHPTNVPTHVSSQREFSTSSDLLPKLAAAALAIALIFGLATFSDPSGIAGGEIAAAANPTQLLSGIASDAENLSHVLAARLDDLHVGLSFPEPAGLPAASGIALGNSQPRSTSQSATANSNASLFPALIATTTVERPIVERVIEQVATPASLASANFVTNDQFNQGLSALDASLRQLIAANTFSAIASPPLGGGAPNTIAAGDAIDQLANTTITGGSISGANISGGSVTATAFSGTLSIGSGGTGISTAPAYGQLLLGDSSGAYDLVSTSSLGINISPAGSDTQVQFNSAGSFAGSPAFTFATSTDLLSVANASTTNATSTNFFATTASSSNLYATNANLGALTLGTLNLAAGTSTDFFASVASSTNLFAQTATVGSLSANSLLLTSALPISSGGTGTSAAPSYGQLLIGNASGGYDLVATSSLGIESAIWGNITGTLSDQTDLENALDSKFSLADWYGTTTDALKEGTDNLYFTAARAQNAISVAGAPLSYASGVIGINEADASQPGYLSAADWTTFNGKLASTSLSGEEPITYDSGTGQIGFDFGNPNTWTGLQSFSNASTTLGTISNLWLPGITANSLLAVNGAGQVVATTSIGTNLLTGTLGTINGQTLAAGGSVTTSAASSTLLSDNNTFSGSDIFSSPLSLTSTTGTTTIAGAQGFTVGGSQFVVQQESGNVGIGTTSPFANLSVQNDNVGATTIFSLASSTASDGSSAVSLFSVSNTGTTTIGNPAATGDAVFQFADSANAWSVGYRASDQTFDIASSTNIDGTPALSIAKNGNATFDGSGGTCTINGAGACTSDERLKTDIAPLSGTTTLADLSKLSGVTFYWSDPTWIQTQNVGVIAQQVLAVYPQLVGEATTTFDGVPGSYYTVNYAGLTAPLISGINQVNGVFNATNASTSAPSILSLYQGTTAALTINQFGNLSIGTSTATTTTDQKLCLNGECVAEFPFFTSATSTASSPSLAADFLSAIENALTAWLSDAANGIQQIYAAIGNFGTVNTNELCVGSTCVTPAQFQSMVAAMNQSSAGDGSAGAAASSSNDSSANGTPPQIQINGNNPATVDVGATYTDLGAQITGPTADLNLSITASVDGASSTPIADITIDTSQPGTHMIVYSATDQNGLTGTAQRTVNVVAPQTSDDSGSSATSTLPSDSSDTSSASNSTSTTP